MELTSALGPPHLLVGSTSGESLSLRSESSRIYPESSRASSPGLGGDVTPEASRSRLATRRGRVNSSPESPERAGTPTRRRRASLQTLSELSTRVKRLASGSRHSDQQDLSEREHEDPQRAFSRRTRGIRFGAKVDTWTRFLAPTSGTRASDRRTS